MDISEYALEVLRDDGELTLSRARSPCNSVSILTLVARRSAQKAVARLEHEFGLSKLLELAMGGSTTRPPAG